MGLGDVKFMAAIGAFLGWKAVIFSLMLSSFIGAVTGLTLVLIGKRALSSRLPYGPYIALAAAIWIFKGRDLLGWYQNFVLNSFGRGGPP
jgi:leader peptidase (prepilin peptidase)/N-methyltransferase